MWASIEGRADRNYATALWIFVGGRRNAVQERWGEFGDAVATRSDVPSRLSNTLFVPHPPKEPEALEALLSRGFRFFDRRPWRVVTTGGAAGRVGDAAGKHGMTLARGDPGFVLSPVPTVPQPPRWLQIERVRSASSMRDWQRVAGEAFQIPQFAMRRIFPPAPPPASPEHTTTFLVGYERGRPVGSAVSVVTEGISAVHIIGAVKSARGRGVGTAMTWSAVAEGTRLGGGPAFLQATEMGEPVYRKMGFQKVEEYPEWHSPRAPGTRSWAIRSALSLMFAR